MKRRVLTDKPSSKHALVCDAINRFPPNRITLGIYLRSRD
jgi:hypothetical protein